MLSLVIGVTAVIAIVALGAGAKAVVERQVQFSRHQSGHRQCRQLRPPGACGSGGSSSRLTTADADAIRAEITGVAALSPQVRSRQQLINGTAELVGERRGGRGRPATRSPLAARPRFVLSLPTTSSVPIWCAVQRRGVRQRLFDSSVDPIGRHIRIGAHIFRVVGVMTRKGQSSGGQDQDDAVFVPVTTAQKKLMGQVTYLRDIYVSAATSEAVAGVAENIRHLLRRLHQIAPGGPDDFRVRTLEDIIAVRTRTVRTMTTLLSAVAAVSLLVGGIGVMNIMLVAVERSAPGRSGSVSPSAPASAMSACSS